MRSSGFATCVVGVDLSADQTACVVVDALSQAVLRRVQGPSLLPTALTEPGGLSQLGQVVSTAWTLASSRTGLAAQQPVPPGAAAAATVARLASVCIAVPELLPGELQQQVAAAIRQALGLAQLPVSVQLAPLAALAAANDGVMFGCVVVADAGIVVMGVGEQGAEARASGWGHAFMDGGSGFDLGSRALCSVAKAADGRGAPTALQAMVIYHLGLQTSEQLRAWAQGGGATPAAIAALAPCVLDCAVAGDAVADAILRHGVGEVLRSVRVVASTLDLDRPGTQWRLLLLGSLLAERSPYALAITDGIKECLPHAVVAFPRVEPAVAAAQLAARAAP